MVENVGRRIALIAVLLTVSVLLLTVPLAFDRSPMRLGLDLAGGSRYVFRLDFEEAVGSGAIDASQDRYALVQETIAIVRQRIDPNGVREPVIRSLGEDRIEVSIPAAAELSSEPGRATLAEPLAGAGDQPALLKPFKIAVADGKELDKFPGGGGVIQVDEEKVRYGARIGDTLTIEERGTQRTQIAEHQPGASVVLVSDDQVVNAISNLGEMRFYIGASRGDFTAKGTDEATEQAKVVAWLQKPENAGLSIRIYNELAPEQGGPPPGIRWFPRMQEEGEAPIPREARLLALVVPKAEWTFTGESLETIEKSADSYGFPAVSFRMRPAFVTAFTDFTTAHVDQTMAITLNDEIASYATINGPLPGQAQIYGRFTDTQVDQLVRVLRSGSLKIKPVLEAKEDIGATLGQEYVDQGWVMGLVAYVFVAAFMIAYFRWLGLYAAIGLAANVLMQMGALSAFQATLTMPGIAGIILGIGMAVDANILVFERIREEQEAGQKPAQAVTAGFKNAFSAIFDSNVTTILTGLILYYVGSGPIRGFAVTLIIGVLTSMFAALVIVRVLLHFHVKRHPTGKFKVGRWLADARYDILGKTRIAMTISAALIIGGLALFAALEPKRKYGIDFLGGATAKVRTEMPQEQKAISERIARIPGDVGLSAEVAALPSSSVGGGRYTEFRITFKTDRASAQGGEETFQNEIRAALADVLQKGPVEVALEPSGDSTKVSGELYFSEEHPSSDVAALLATAGVLNAQVEPRADRRDVSTFTGTVGVGLGRETLINAITTTFQRSSDSAGRKYELPDPIPETSVIGQRVVGELKNSAVKALLLAVLVIVIYIRVRFAEYSYGIAAVVALLHDILITIGAVAFLVWVPWIHIEFDLGLIAVFLTIMGYSLNDTIVVFDRIRENLPRRKGTLKSIVNDSINETLSRTVITSTSMATIFIVLIFNIGTGSPLEGFAFAMTFGILTGTFSSVYVAAPLFVWLEQRAQRKQAAEASKPTLPAQATP